MPFVSIDIWTIIMQWGNLLILLLLMKKFLFMPVMAVLEKRADEIKASYKEAERAKNEAYALENEYTKKLASAYSKADEIVKTAVESAKTASDDIVSEAKDKANAILERANEKILIEQKSAVDEVKNEISDIAITIAGKIIEKDITPSDHICMIEEFIEEMGEAS